MAGNERQRNTEDELEANRQSELAFLRKLRAEAVKSLGRLPKRSRSTSWPPARR